MKSKTLGVYKVLLTTLITSISITGISLLDDKIWNLVMLILGMITYSIVGIMFSIGLISGRNAGKRAYSAVFIVLLIVGYCVYQGIVTFQEWILSWSPIVKIIVPVSILIMIVGTIILMFYSRQMDAD
jgi:protein-S-isoprenylcysteine O-methyltransferase Ste14